MSDATADGNQQHEERFGVAAAARTGQARAKTTRLFTAEVVRDSLLQHGVTARLNAEADTLHPTHLRDYHGRSVSALTVADGSIALVPVLQAHDSKINPHASQVQSIWRSSETYEIASRDASGAWMTHGKVAIQGRQLVAIDPRGQMSHTGVQADSLAAWEGVDIIAPPGGEVSLKVDHRRHLEFAGGMNRVTMAEMTMLGGPGEPSVTRTVVLKVPKFAERNEQIAAGYLTAAEALARNPKAPVPVTHAAGYSDNMLLGLVGKRSFFAVEEFMSSGASLQDFITGTAKVGGVEVGRLSAHDVARLTSVAARSVAELNIVQGADGSRRPAAAGERIHHTDLKPDNLWINHDPEHGGWSATIIDKDAFLREGRGIPGGAAHQSPRYGDVVVGNALASAQAKSPEWDNAERSMVAQLAAGMLMPYMEDCAPRGDDAPPAYTAAHKEEWISNIRRIHQVQAGSALDSYLGLVEECVSWDWGKRPSLEQFIARLDGIADQSE